MDVSRILPEQPAAQSRRLPSLLLAAVFLGAPTQLAVAAPTTAPAFAQLEGVDAVSQQASAFRELRRRLLAHAAKPEGVSERGLARQLSNLGEPLVPVVFDLLLGSDEPPPWQQRVAAEAEAEPVGEDELPFDALPIGPLEQRVLMHVLGSLPEDVVLKAVRARLDENTDVGTRRVLALALGHLRTPGGLAALFDVMQGIPTEHMSRAFVYRPFEDAFVELLQTTPALHTNLRAKLVLTDAAYWPPLVRGVARARKPQGLDLLAGLLGREGGSDDLLLQGLAEMAVDPRLEVGGRVFAWLTPYLEDPTWSRRHASALILSARGGLDAVEVLIGLLGDEHAVVRHTALQALQSASGRRFAAEERDRWKAWLEAEATWQAEELDELGYALRSQESAEVLAALAQLELHPSAITASTADLGRVVSGAQSPGARAQACTTLARSRSVAALEILVSALEDREPAVAAAARASLRRLTGLDLGAERGAWDTWILGGVSRS